MIIDVLVEDKLDNTWLNYILECFLSISKANFKFNVCSKESQLTSDVGLIIAYGVRLDTQSRRVIEIPRINQYRKDEYCHISASALTDHRLTGTNIPVYTGTISGSIESGKTLITFEDGKISAALMNGRSIIISFDILYNAFLHISCLEEYEIEKKQQGIPHSYAYKAAKILVKYQIPVVNYLFAILEDFITRIADQSIKKSLFLNRDSFDICLSHDVDYIEKTAQLVLKNFAFQTYKALEDLKRLRLKEGFTKLWRGFYFIVTGCNYWQFEYIQQLEEAYGFRSTFYIYVNEKPARKFNLLRKLLFDPSYDLNKNPKLRDKLMELIEKGWEVGLHGSFDSFDSTDILSGEAKRLSEIINMPVISTRQHWLRLSFENTWRVHHNSSIRIDSTLGFNDLSGFRAGSASPFHPYDFYSNKRHEVLEIPMVLMDGTLFDYEQLSNEDALRVCITILNEAKKFGGCVAINWHQRTASKDYGWYYVYEEILKWIKSNGGTGIALKDYEKCMKYENVL